MIMAVFLAVTLLWLHIIVAAVVFARRGEEAIRRSAVHESRPAQTDPGPGKGSARAANNGRYQSRASMHIDGILI